MKARLKNNWLKTKPFTQYQKLKHFILAKFMPA
jgi:hypothetical protein